MRRLYRVDLDVIGAARAERERARDDIASLGIVEQRTPRRHGFTELADPKFAERPERALFDQKRAVMIEAGFGDLKLRCLSQALPESAGGEIPGRVIFDGSRHLGSRGRR